MHTSARQPRLYSTSSTADQLSHVDTSGKAKMVNVSGKKATHRTATAIGRVCLSKDTYHLVDHNSMSKGDVLTVAKIAGIQGSKLASSIIPLCHPLGEVTHVAVNLSLSKESLAVDISCRVEVIGRTGCEMEALAGVSAAALTVYDMCKAVDKGIRIGDIQLVEKTGGKSDTWKRTDL